MIISIIILVLLFCVLGFSADLVVKKIQFITAKLRLRLFNIGIILGIVTSLPEFAIGINSIIDDSSTISVGNLYGGIIVLLGLILGVSLIVNRGVKTDGHVSLLVPEAVFIFFPLLLGLRNGFSFWDGFLILCSFVALLYYLFKKNKYFKKPPIPTETAGKTINQILLLIVGIIILMIASHLIMQIAGELVGETGINEFFIGLVFFSIGTNIPEITIALTSWRQKSPELSLSHLVGSAVSNICVLGILAVIRPIVMEIDAEYYLLMLFLGLLLIAFVVFYHTGKRLNRVEGVAMLAIYLAFVITNLFFAK